MADALGFPDASSTGVPAGMTLTPYNGNLVINTPGAVISGLDIHGTVLINAPNVTLIDCKVTSSTGFNIVALKDGITGVTIQNCEITGTGNGVGGSTGIWGSGGTFIGNNIWGVENGITPTGNNTVIQDNYIHDLNTSAGSAGHYDGIQAFGGYSNLTIRHNTIDGRDTSDIFITTLWGPISNVIVDDNKLIGTAGATLRVYSDPNGGAPGNVQITNNVIQKGQWFAVDIQTPISVWSNNTDYTTNRILAQDGSLSGPTSQLGITAFSTDSGVAGDHITNDNTLTLTGTAAANSTVKVFDGTNQIGTATANAAGRGLTRRQRLADGVTLLVSRPLRTARTDTSR